jgi:hypothetical protein
MQDAPSTLVAGRPTQPVLAIGSVDLSQPRSHPETEPRDVSPLYCSDLSVHGDEWRGNFDTSSIDGVVSSPSQLNEVMTPSGSSSQPRFSGSGGAVDLEAHLQWVVDKTAAAMKNESS